MSRAILCFALVLAMLGGSDADDQIIVLPPAKSSKNTGLLVWVPGGLVPNTFYVPLMKKLQTHLMGKIDLWVSIASCPNMLCIPGGSPQNLTNALNAGRKASGVTAPKFTWLGGHSLGGEAADNACIADNATEFSGCALWGSYIFSGPTGMLAYPVPVLSIVPELDYGSARITKMAPYWSAANEKGSAQMFRTPVIVLPDVDHSDMCQGFNVPGDLPSASPALEAIDRITMATASFMLAHILQDSTSVALMESHIAFSRPLMEPIVEALALDLRSAKWCAKMQLELAGSLAANVSVADSYFSGYDSDPWLAPTANRSDAGVIVRVTGRNAYEDDGGLWPPGAVPAAATASLSARSGVPAPMRDTASSLGCRLVSKTKIAALLGKKVREPDNFCHTANSAAWQWALDHAPKRVLNRYHSDKPCNKCSPGVPVVLNNDVNAGSDFVNLTLAYNLSAKSLIVESPEYVTSEEHSCMLLSPARLLDFLYFDAYSASIYPDSLRRVAPSTFVI
jgi:hypothetical protein